MRVSNRAVEMGDAFLQNWPEYLIEAGGLGTFMVFAGVLATLLG